MRRAIILCEGFFGKPAAKTTEGLVRRSRRFRILGVVDSSIGAGDAGELIDGAHRGVPMFPSVAEAIDRLDERPDCLIVGVAPIGGRLPAQLRPGVLAALQSGLDVISGLHEQLSDDPELSSLARSTGASIVDIRREPPLDKLRYFRDVAKDLPCVRLPVLGTDAAIGKRTTALALVDALDSLGVKSVFVATGQTGLLQGSEFGVPLDAVRGDFAVGELEGEIVRAFEAERPDVIVIEGQGSLSHPAYVMGSRAILSASAPTGIVLQHAPRRRYRSFHEDELHIPMVTVEREMELIKVVSGAPVIAITLNHQGMSRTEVQETIEKYEHRFGMPCADVLWFGAEELATHIARRYSLLR